MPSERWHNRIRIGQPGIPDLEPQRFTIWKSRAHRYQWRADIGRRNCAGIARYRVTGKAVASGHILGQSRPVGSLIFLIRPGSAGTRESRGQHQQSKRRSGFHRKFAINGQTARAANGSCLIRPPALPASAPICRRAFPSVARLRYACPGPPPCTCHRS